MKPKISKTVTQSRSPPHPLLTSGLAFYGLAFILMALFIQTVPVWQWLAKTLPTWAAVALPGAVLALLVAAVCVFVLRDRTRRAEINWRLFGGGILLCVAALLLTDPAFPAKRIHSAEYLALALIIRRAAAARVHGIELVVYSAILTALLGIHDELIQGLHPDRGFGLRDIGVNATAGLGGSLIGAALGLFESPSPSDHASDSVPRPTPHPSISPSVLAIIAGLALFLFALPAFHDIPIPWWTVAPLLMGGALWCGALKPQVPPRAGGAAHPYLIAVWLALITPVYVLIANVTPLVFH